MGRGRVPFLVNRAPSSKKPKYSTKKTLEERSCGEGIGGKGVEGDGCAEKPTQTHPPMKLKYKTVFLLIHN